MQVGYSLIFPRVLGAKSIGSEMRGSWSFACFGILGEAIDFQRSQSFLETWEL